MEDFFKKFLLKNPPYIILDEVLLYNSLNTFQEKIRITEPYLHIYEDRIRWPKKKEKAAITEVNSSEDLNLDDNESDLYGSESEDSESECDLFSS